MCCLQLRCIHDRDKDTLLVEGEKNTSATLGFYVQVESFCNTDAHVHASCGEGEKWISFDSTSVGKTL